MGFVLQLKLPDLVSRNTMTVAYSVVLLFLLSVLFNPFSEKEQLDQLKYVGESAGRMMDRHAGFYVGYENVSRPESELHTFLFGSREEVEAEAIRTYQEVLNFFSQHPRHTSPWARMNIQARLLVALGESGRLQELEKMLAQLPDNPEEEAIADAIRFAYQAVSQEEVYLPGIISGARLLPLGWAGDMLQIRIAQKTGDSLVEKHVWRRRLDYAQGYRSNVLKMTLLVATVLFMGMFCLWRYRVLGRITTWSNTLAQQAWSWQEGYSIAIRAAVYGLLIVAGLQMLASQFFRPGILASWSTLFASLPMLWLMHYYLLRPRKLSFRQAFGLGLCGTNARGLITITLGFLVIEWAGMVLIGWLGWKLGLSGHWSESVHERLIFGPAETVWLSAVNFVVWAAVFEEIGFRGLLYTSLKQRFTPYWAMIISALIFSALHLYSLTGFISVFWSGLVLAYLYERTNSLLPGILIHAAGNLLSLSTVVLFYR